MVPGRLLVGVFGTTFPPGIPASRSWRDHRTAALATHFPAGILPPVESLRVRLVPRAWLLPDSQTWAHPFRIRPEEWPGTENSAKKSGGFSTCGPRQHQGPL